MAYVKDNFDTGQHEDGLCKFKSIKDHRGPCTSTDPEYLGSSYNLLIEWETGEMTWEPLSNIIADDPYSCAVYAKKLDLLNTPGWKQLKTHARTAKRLITTHKKSKYRQAKASKRYMHGWEVQRDYAHAIQLDGKAVYEKNKVINAHPRSIRKLEYLLCLMSNIVGSSKQDLWQMDTSPKNPMKLSIQELFP